MKGGWLLLNSWFCLISLTWHANMTRGKLTILRANWHLTRRNTEIFWNLWITITHADYQKKEFYSYFIFNRSICDLNGFTLKKIKARSKLYPAETITDADYADDQALLANISYQVKSLLHRLEQPARSISFNVNSDKTELVCFNQDGAMTLLNGKTMKLVDQLTYFGSNISSTESSINKVRTRYWP